MSYHLTASLQSGDPFWTAQNAVFADGSARITAISRVAQDDLTTEVYIARRQEEQEKQTAKEVARLKRESEFADEGSAKAMVAAEAAKKAAQGKALEAMRSTNQAAAEKAETEKLTTKFKTPVADPAKVAADKQAADKVAADRAARLAARSAATNSASQNPNARVAVTTVTNPVTQNQSSDTNTTSPAASVAVPSSNRMDNASSRVNASVAVPSSNRMDNASSRVNTSATSR